MTNNKPLRIFFAIDTLQTGGAERSILDIASRLPEGIEPYVVTFYKAKTILSFAKENTTIKFIHFELDGKYDFIKGIRLFTELCKVEKPDVVVATLFRTEIITRVVCKQLGIPNIGTFVNDTYSPYEMESLSLLRKAKIIFFKKINSVTAKYCTHFLSNAQSIKISNAKALRISEDKISVIYRGRDVSKFTYDPLKENLDNQFRFLNIGRLLPRKGQSELIQAFALFQKKYPKATLSIAGEGKYRAGLKKLIIENNLQEKVTLLGTVSDVNSLFQQHDFFIFPSHYEGFSGAVVEAMLGGIPVIASDIAMNKEAVEHLQTGYLFPVKNIAALTSAMEYAVSNKKQMLQMAKNARQYAVENFDIDKIASAHAALYKTIVKP